MKPDLGFQTTPDFTGWPPHMSSVDFILWQRFRRKFPLAFGAVYYDVAVGPGTPAGAGATAAVLEAWLRITRHRVDVVGEGAAGWVLIEVRGAAGPGAVGSLVVYRNLWNADPPDTRPVRLWLVTDIFSEALQATLREQEIELYLV